jgi:D-arabinose 1-dehydrogenase-like Zn-dependent alcohol dehydrogenase
MVRYGICGENAIVPSHGVAHYPENLSLAEGASIWMPYMTAYSVLVHYGKLKKGYAVLIPAARNSVGWMPSRSSRPPGGMAIAATDRPRVEPLPFSFRESASDPMRKFANVRSVDKSRPLSHDQFGE